MAFALSRISSHPDGPTPIGVFRDIDRPVYDKEVSRQIAAVTEKRGPGDLQKLIGSQGTWTVE
jgi:2-oxoglutarate ferredoxin oxidoreductase subunit beta